MIKRHRLGQVRVDTNESCRTATETPSAELERHLCARGVGVLKEENKRLKQVRKMKNLLTTAGVVRDVAYKKIGAILTSLAAPNPAPKLFATLCPILSVHWLVPLF
jgi:hypothetical protein